MARVLPALLLCSAIAVIAAAVADPLVETASNAGIFGRGTFTDHCNADVLPALVLGLLFLGISFGTRLRALFSERSDPSPNWLRICTDILNSQSLPRLLPAIYALQIAILYVMESAEQFVVAGHLMGGAIWLGGPVLISLAAHAIACLATAFAVSATLRACARALVRLVILIRAIALRPAHADLRIASAFHVRSHRQAAPVLCRIGERAPPFLTA